MAVDIDARKLEWARRFGATHTVNSAAVDPVEAIKDLTDGFGADVVIEAVGRPETYRQAFFARRPGRHPGPGRRARPVDDDRAADDRAVRAGRGLEILVVRRLPAVRRDFPMLIDLYLQGRLDLDGFVSETIGLEGVEEAFARMERGEVLRSVVVM